MPVHVPLPLTLPRLLPGDIVAVRGRGLVGRLIRAIDDSYVSHVALVVGPLAHGDYEIAEALGQGIVSRRLSVYRGQVVYIWRSPLLRQANQLAPASVREFALSYGGHAYDWPLLLKIALHKLGLPVQYRRNDRFLCTELVQDFLVSRGIVIAGEPPTLRTFIQAIEAGDLDEIAGPVRL